jgi:hypothetical protein
MRAREHARIQILFMGSSFVSSRLAELDFKGSLLSTWSIY